MNIISHNTMSSIPSNFNMKNKNRRSIEVNSFLEKINENEQVIKNALESISSNSPPNNNNLGRSSIIKLANPLSRSKSLDKRDVTINPPLPRFGHSLIVKQAPTMRPSLESNPSYNININNMSHEDMSKERISRCRTRKLLMNIPKFKVNHEIIEIENKFVKTKSLISFKRKLIKQSIIVKDNGKTQSKRKFYLFNDILVYGSFLSEDQFKMTNKELFKQITVSLNNLWVEECDDSKQFSLWMTTEKEHFKILFNNLKEKMEWYNAIQNTLNEYHNRKHNQSMQSQNNSLLNSNLNHFFKTFSLPGSPVIKSIKGWTMSRKLSFNSITSEESNTSSISWIPDNYTDKCMVCNDTKFSILIRKHHCRECGYIICFRCSKYTINNNKKQRCCSLCYQKANTKICQPKSKLSNNSINININNNNNNNNNNTLSPSNSDNTLLPNSSSPISIGSLSDSGSDNTFNSINNSSSLNHIHAISPLNPSHPSNNS